MAFFRRTQTPRTQPPDMDDCAHLAALGDDPDAWPDLEPHTLREVLALKILEYGTTLDGGRIPGLFALYRHAMTRLPVAVRRQMLQEFSGLTEQNGGLGHMGLMAFLGADTDPGIRSSAALSLAVLFDPGGGDQLAGPRRAGASNNPRGAGGMRDPMKR